MTASGVLVAGIDSSTQSCKVTVRDLATGVELRSGKASHPGGTIVDPRVWWEALLLAVQRAGGIEDVAAVAVSGQQHTPIFLDAAGEIVCDSPLWNDTSSHAHVEALNDELGREEWIRRTGLPLTLSDTVVKLRWLRDTDPEAADRTAAVALVHDWLSWRLMGYGGGVADGGSGVGSYRRGSRGSVAVGSGSGGLDALTTDRSEASGTAYWAPDTGEYCVDLLTHALGKTVLLPRVLGPDERAGFTGRSIPGVPAGIPIGVGSGDNAAAALALDLVAGETVMSLGTSGVVYTRSSEPVYDLKGYVCSYADAAGGFLPLVATLNAARNFDAGCTVLGCDYAELSRLALGARPGAGGLTLLPFFEGERTPELPAARASLLGATLENFTRENLARAVIEGTLISQVGMLRRLSDFGLPTERLLLIGGGASSPAVRAVLGQSVDVPVAVPAPDEYVARGAALQAARALSGEFPRWRIVAEELPRVSLDPRPERRYAAAMRTLGYLDRTR